MFLLNKNEQNKICVFAQEKHAITVNSFDELPVLNKKLALDYFNIPVSLNQKSYASTGTSGNPKKINWSIEEDLWYIQEKRDFILPFLKECTSVFISLGVGHGAGTSPMVFKDSHLACKRCSFEPVSEQLTIIEKINAHVLYCSPSIATSLIQHSKKEKVNLSSIKKLVLNGEVVHSTMKDFFCNELEIEKKDILDTYGSTEVGTIAYSCNKCNKYHFMPEIYPETIPAKDLPYSMSVNENILILSSLKRTSFPVIRFATYDIIRGLDRTVCEGKEYFTYDEIIGRTDDVLNFGELLPVGDLKKVIKKYYPTNEYVMFNYNNEVDIVIQGEKNNMFVDEIYAVYPTINELIQKGILNPFRLHFFSDISYLVQKNNMEMKSYKDSNRIIKSKFIANE